MIRKLSKGNNGFVKSEINNTKDKFKAYKADKENKIMKNINTQKANEIKVNGNSKGVRCLTDGKFYPRMKDAAKEARVTSSSMSYAIKNKTLCNGKRYAWESEMESNVMEMGRQLSEMDTIRAKAIAYDKLMLEQKAKEEAEAKRIEFERKAKEEHEKAIAKAKANIAKYEAEVERRKEKLYYAEQKLMCAEIELEALMDKEVA